MRLALIVVASFAAFATAETAGTARQDEAAKEPAAAKPLASGPDSASGTFGDWSILGSTLSKAAERGCEVSTPALLREKASPFARNAGIQAAQDKPARTAALVPANVSGGSPVEIGGDAGRLDASLRLGSRMPAACAADVEFTRELARPPAAPAEASGQLTVVDGAGTTETLQFSLRELDQALDA